MPSSTARRKRGRPRVPLRSRRRRSAAKRSGPRYSRGATGHLRYPAGNSGHYPYSIQRFGPSSERYLPAEPVLSFSRSSLCDCGFASKVQKHSWIGSVPPAGAGGELISFTKLPKIGASTTAPPAPAGVADPIQARHLTFEAKPVITISLV